MKLSAPRVAYHDAEYLGGRYTHMEITEFIEAVEEKSSVFDKGIKFANEQLEIDRLMKDRFRVIKEMDWQKLKKKALMSFFVDDDEDLEERDE